MADNEVRGFALLPSEPLVPDDAETTGMRCRWIIPPRPGGWDLALFEWELERAAWSDLHHHIEANVVVEGELHVTCGDQTLVAGPGETISVPAGAAARYAAPGFARMIGAYGPSTGRADELGRYDEL